MKYLPWKNLLNHIKRNKSKKYYYSNSILGRKNAGRILQLAPKPMLTLDQIKTLESGDNIATNNNKTFKRS